MNAADIVEPIPDGAATCPKGTPVEYCRGKSSARALRRIGRPGDERVNAARSGKPRAKRRDARASGR